MLNTYVLHANNQEAHKQCGSATFRMVVGPDNIMSMSMAVCSKNDQFSRKLGRGISADRLTQGKEVVKGYYHPSLAMRFNVVLALLDFLKANEDDKNTPEYRLVEKAKLALDGYTTYS